MKPSLGFDFTPRQLLWASIMVALITIGLKTWAWYITDSVGLLSDAMESLVNLASAMFGLTMVTVAALPPDEEHPYGHHKAEYFSSGFEGILIIVAALCIVWTAAHRFSDPQPLQEVGLGLALSVGSSMLNGLLAWVMMGAARQHRSMALEADAKHLITDVWTSVGVVLGIVLVQWSGWLWLDAVVAIGVALNILREGVQLVSRAFQGLMDQAVEPDVQAQIHAVLANFAHQPGEAHIVRFDHLTTRKAGQRLRRALERRLRGPAVRRGGGLGERDAGDARVQRGGTEIGEVHVGARGPHHQPAGGENPQARGVAAPASDERARGVHVGRQEDVERRAVGNLRKQSAGRAECGRHLHLRREAAEPRVERVDDVGEVGGGGHGNPGAFGRAAGGRRGQEQRGQ